LEDEPKSPARDDSGAGAPLGQDADWRARRGASALPASTEIDGLPTPFIHVRQKTRKSVAADRVIFYHIGLVIEQMKIIIR
jgi:hypothetical protein